MSFFGSVPNRITKEEWSDIVSNLYGKLDDRERNELEKFFRADLFEPGDEAGITQAEFDAGITWLRSNMGKHELEASDIALIESAFTEHLRD